MHLNTVNYKADFLHQNGFILIDKPVNCTSMAVVRKLKHLLKIESAGHLGTLDPFASGLLPVLFGGANKLASLVIEGKKGYTFSIQLGTETDTLDPTGNVIDEAIIPANIHLKSQLVCKQFMGKQQQIPPVYSAIKMNGMPLYEHMRATGKLPKDIESKIREIEIFQIELLESEGNSASNSTTLTYRVVCSKGTYIRSLARDIAKFLGTVGHCSNLRRELVEPWSVKDAFPLSMEQNKSIQDNFELINTLQQKIELPYALTPNIPMLCLDSKYEKPFSSGNQFKILISEFLEYCLNSNHEFFNQTPEQITNYLNNSKEMLNFFVKINNTCFLSELQIHLNDGIIQILPRRKIA